MVHRLLMRFSVGFLTVAMASGLPGWPVVAGESPAEDVQLDLQPAILESPTLQRWRQETPDLFQENNSNPAFLPKIRLGYNYFPSGDRQSGLGVGVEDWFIGDSAVSVSGDYYTSFAGRQGGGANLQYYLLPLGWYVNVTPLVGYRAVAEDNFHSQGLNLGGKVIFALSRTGAADVSFSQNFVAPGGDAEVGISTLSVGYAISPQWRLATDLQRQNFPGGWDNRVGVYLEWQQRN